MFEHLLQRYEPSPHEVLEVLQLHQLTYEFRREQHYREDLEAYCQTYYHLAAEHQRDYAAMQNEPDFFGLFWKRRNHA